MKKLIFLSLIGFFLTVLNLNAQLIAPIRISNDTETFDSPGTVISADMDNDGDIDLVASGVFNGNIVWYENLDGGGALDDPKIIVSFGTFGVDFISVMDVDGDGIMDVFGMNEDEVFWVKNTVEETATFSDPIYLPVSTISYGRDAKMEDINGDDILDIILVGHALSLLWLEGIDGNGNFHPAVGLINDGRYYIELADFDNDGDLDIVSVSYDNSNGDFSLGWFENLDGNANFASFQTIDPLISSPQDLQIADLDADGDTDILLGVTTHISNAHYYFWYENTLNENGSWTKKVISDTEGIAPPTIFDIDADNDLDIVTTQEGLRIYENVDGLGSFEPSEILGVYGGSSLTHADINNDGIQDIIGVYRTSTENQELGLLFFGRADLTFENPIDYIGDADQIPTFYGGFMEGKDLNGDGIVELISSHYPLRRFSWQTFDNSQLKFSNPRIIDDVQAEDIDFADFDGDGDEDIVVATSQSGNNQVIWYEKLNGEDNFGPANVLFNEHQSTKQVHAVDLDDDEDMDIVLSKPGGDNSGIHWFENLDGQGNFSAFQNINSGYFDYIQMEDVDLDGDLDIFAYDDNPDGFFWLENNNAVFSDPVLLLEIENVKTYVLEDLDGNGWKDLIYINIDNVVVLHKNNGGVGDYADAINFSGLNPTFAEMQLFLRDYDLDGDQDLLVSEASFNGSFLYFFEHVGGQDIFLNGANIYDLPESSLRVSIDDYDGDQDLDIVFHNHAELNMHFIENFLDKAKIVGKAYLDANENANFDTGELLVFPQSIIVDPDALATFPSGSGYFNFAVDNGNYDVTCNVFPGFEFTTPSTVQVEVSDDLITEVSYGIFSVEENIGTLVAITSAPTRCGFEVPFWIDYQNTGTVAGNAVIAFEMDSLAGFISSDPMPDSIVGLTIYWSHTNLPPTHSGQIDLLVQMPGVEHLGEYLSFSSIATITSLDGLHTAFQGVGYRPQVNCAFDPNDKLVEPSLPGNKNYTLVGDTLDYTVRFQNTGTDTAFTVIIEDYLDRDLDYSTMNVIGASHPYKVTLDENTGRMLFVFENILLPDSTTNETKSHGYFRYRIQHLNGLPELTYIQNYASIFFDFNPPIITNTVENILVSSYPVLVNIQHPSCVGDTDGSLTILYELPFFESILWSTGDTSLSITGLSQGEYDLTIFYSDGSQVDTTFLITEPSPVELLDPVVEFVKCFGIDDGSIEITVEGGTPDYYYEWSNFVFTANQYNLAPGIYQLIVTDSRGCKDSLQVILEPPIEIILTADVTHEFEETMNGSISVQISGGHPPYNYSWDFDPNETGNKLSGLSFGDYTVTVTDANGCTQVQTITVEQITHTHDFNKQFYFQVSPNPNDGIFKASISFPNQEVWQVNITNSLGQLVRMVQSSSQSTPREQLHFILEPGLYQIALLVEGKIVQSEIVIVM